MKKTSSQRGQMTVEAVLIMMIMVSFFTLARREIASRNLLQQLVTGPWSYIQGMAENGVWAQPEAGKKIHPNVFGRRASPEPL